MGKILANRSDEPKMGKLVAKILENIDVDGLADSVAQQIGARIMSNFAICELVDKLFEKHQQELQTQITEAIIQQL